MRSLIASRCLSTSAMFRKEDLVSNLFLKRIRDLAAKQKAAGGSLVNSSPELKKQLDEQLNRLAQKFKIPSADVVGKLVVDFEKPTVESSVNAIAVEGKTFEDLLKEINTEHSNYMKTREEKKRTEKERQASA